MTSTHISASSPRIIRTFQTLEYAKNVHAFTLKLYKTDDCFYMNIINARIKIPKLNCVYMFVRVKSCDEL